MKEMFKNKKGQLGGTSGKVLNFVIGVIILSSIASALVGTLLTNLTNLSGSGIFLGAVFTAVVPIIFAVNVLKGMLGKV